MKKPALKVPEKLKKNLDIFDFQRKYPSLYKGKDSCLEIVTVPEMSQVYIEGRGGPTDTGYQSAVASLYSAAFALKYLFKSIDADFVIPPLQAHWWSDEAAGKEGVNTIFPQDILSWHYSVFVPLPSYIGVKHFENAIKNMKDARTFTENHKLVQFKKTPMAKAVQMLKTGAYNDIDESINAIFRYISDNGLTPEGHYCEIYLTDPKRCENRKLKTILRQTVSG